MFVLTELMYREFTGIYKVTLSYWPRSG